MPSERAYQGEQNGAKFSVIHVHVAPSSEELRVHKLFFIHSGDDLYHARKFEWEASISAS